MISIELQTEIFQQTRLGLYHGHAVFPSNNVLIVHIALWINSAQFYDYLTDTITCILQLTKLAAERIIFSIYLVINYSNLMHKPWVNKLEQCMRRHSNLINRLVLNSHVILNTRRLLFARIVRMDLLFTSAPIYIP